MNTRGENPSENVIAIIPARLASTRLEGKLLLSLDGKPLILHTLEQAKAAKYISRVIVATDSPEIQSIVLKSGNEAVLTSPAHQSGSDRIAEVAEKLPENSIIVNVQGDEPLIPQSTIEKAVEAVLQDAALEIATTCERIFEIKDVLSPDVVKVITDENDFALYFSRSPIPFPREAVKKYGSLEKALENEKDLIAIYRKHTGLYVFRREFLLKYTKMPQTKLEKLEMLEQLRALENGTKIKVVEVAENSIGVDTREDFERVQQILDKPEINFRAAVFEDIPQIAKVHVESWQKSFKGLVAQEFLDKMSIDKRIRAFEKSFSENTFYKMVVADKTDKGIVGFADFGKSRAENFFESELYAIYFLPEFQRKGIGGNLFKFVIEELKREGINSMFLEALEISPYKSFYEKMGGEVNNFSYHKIANQEFKTLVYGWKDLSKF